MFRIPRRAVIVAVTAVFGTGLLGSAAFAAFAPTSDYTFSLDQASGAVTLTEAPKADALKTILDGLVAKNVITQAQEDAILAAVRDAHADRDAVLKRVFGGLLQESATYLGIQPKDLRAQLAGTSLGAIADKTGGKGRGGLIADLTAFANGAVDKAVADGKLTQDEAAKLKATLPGRITKFVDRTWPLPKPNVRAFIGDFMKDARDYLGLPRKDIASQLRAGKSLGEIAEATPGKSRAGLIDAIVDDANAKIAKAVTDGKLTQAQADQLKTTVRDAVTKMVDRKGSAPKANGTAPKANN